MMNAERTKLIRRLHAVAAEAIEAQGLDLDPHDLARQATGVASLGTATDAQLRNGIRTLSRGRATPSAAGAPTGGTRRSNPRKRRARPGGPGVIKLPTPKQKALIQKLLSRLGWASGRICQRLGEGWVHEPDGPATDGRYWNAAMTARGASDAINTLIGECKRNRM